MTGAFGGVTLVASGSISTAVLAGLSDGAHAVSVHGRDAAGNWGPLASSSLVIDRTGPAASGGAVAPSPSQGSVSATLSASLTDASSNVVAGEWFIGADTGPGNGSGLEPADGAFDSATESVRGTIALAGRPFGELIASFRGRDGAGTWGPVASAPFLVTPADGVFADGFESGAADRWTSSTGGARLTVTSAAAMAGLKGLSVTVSGATAAYVTDATPTALATYHARFGFDGRGLVTSGKAVDILTGLNAKGSQIIGLEYRRDAGAAGLVRVGALVGRSMTWSAWATLPDGRRALEVSWLAAATGSVGLTVDGQAALSLGPLDTRASALETVRLGAIAGLAKGMAGELQFDRFVSTRGSSIGP